MFYMTACFGLINPEPKTAQKNEGLQKKKNLLTVKPKTKYGFPNRVLLGDLQEYVTPN